MSSDPRGLAVIISNQYFVGLKPREGTDCDLKMLRSLFDQLKFTVEKYENLAADVSLICLVYETGAFSFVLLYIYKEHSITRRW